MGRLERMVIHCTATRAGREVTGAEVRLWHCAPKPRGNGWKRPGYARLIRLDGTVDTLCETDDDDWVSPQEVTNGARGWNGTSLHVAYAGGLDAAGRPADTRTERQRAVMREMAADFMRKHPGAEVIGHRDLPGVEKACPGFDVRGWLGEEGLVP